jgi:hypothetical protein
VAVSNGHATPVSEGEDGGEDEDEDEDEGEDGGEVEVEPVGRV